MRLSPLFRTRFYGRNILPLLHSLCGHARYNYFQEINSIQWMTKEHLEKLTLLKLKNLLEHAYHNVPYYKDLFQSLKIIPEDITTFKDYERLPALSRQKLRENFESLKATNYVDNRRLVLNQSGGSTGEPVKFYQNLDYFERMEAGIMRSNSWGGWLPGDRILYLWGAPHELDSTRSVWSKFREVLSGRMICNAYCYSDEVLKDWLEMVRHRSIRFIYGYVSVLAQFANFVKRFGFPPPRIQAIFTTAEVLYPEIRELLESTFCCKVYDQYGSREAVCMASECERGQMHILCDFVHLEFVRESVETLHEVAGIHRLLVTPLESYAMPLLRYDVRDCGDPQEGLCECGRGFPLMKMRVGRVYDNFITPGGQFVYGAYLVRQFHQVKGVKSYQFRQVSPRDILVFIVRDQGADEESLRRQIQGVQWTVQRQICKEWHLIPQFVDSISLTPSGKHRYTVCEVGTLGNKEKEGEEAH